jgi:DnaJ like chaperone protein
MGIGKWITGAIGWALGGPLGGLVGYLLGSLFEGDQSGAQRVYTTGGGFSANEQRNSFLVSLLVLSAAVMKSDGKVLRSELEYVKDFIRRNFGEAALPQALQILKAALEKDINLPEICAQIKLHMDQPQRLQLFHYLVGIANADGHVSQVEINDLKGIASYLGIPAGEANSILAMFGGNDVDMAYKVLEIEPTATDDEVKKAYRQLALKHHPDRVATLGEDVKKAAEEKFQQINNAKEMIYKARGMK